MRVFLILSMLMSMMFHIQVEDEIDKNINGSYCVMSMNDYTILDSYQREHTQSVASISKIMSAIVAIEEGNLQDRILVDDSIDTVDGSSLYLQKEDTYTLEDLLYGLLLRSGNDAAVLIAKHIGNDVDGFVKLMNQKAKALHMDATIFHNPSGLDEEDGGNISSSCDMAVLMSYAMKNKEFAKIVGTTAHTSQNGKRWINKNKFLKTYEYATGGKTGYTKLAKRTLITTSKQKDMQVAVVTLNASDDFYIHQKLHDQAYENYESIKLIDKGIYQIRNHNYHIEDNIYQTIKKGDRDALDVDIKKARKKIVIKVKYGDIVKEYTYE